MDKYQEKEGFVDEKKEPMPMAPDVTKTIEAQPLPPPSPEEVELQDLTTELLKLGDEISKFAHEMSPEEIKEVDVLNNRMEYRLHALTMEVQIREKKIKLEIMREVFEVFKRYALKAKKHGKPKKSK